MATDGADAAADAAILTLIAERRAGASICPSEAARRLEPGDGAEWRAALDRVRAAARRLAHAGAIIVTQRGVPVDIAEARGPIRLTATTGRRPEGRERGR